MADARASATLRADGGGRRHGERLEDTMGKVLVAYDGSDDARLALEYAAAKFGDDDITVVSVVPVPYSGRGGGIDPTSNVEDHRTALDEAADLLADRGVKATTVESVGHPANAIIEMAEKGEFDLVIVGSRGLGAVSRFLTGSVSGRVVAHAPCSVLVVR
jgi:nucleotide-binding universal stress UspA family protein